MDVKRNRVSETRTRTRRGQATVELAILITLLALLLIGVADVARIYSEQLAVVDAAGAAARWATLDPDNRACSPYANVREVVEDDLTYSLPSENIQSVGIFTTTNPPTARVDVTYRHDFLFGLVNNVPNTFTGGATMPGQVDDGSGVCPSPADGTKADERD